MELMTKYQYTYFIYPYLIGKGGYQKYIQKLLKNKKCKLRIFEKEKDMHLYQYFLPDIRNFAFWSFELGKDGLREFEQLSIGLKSKLLSEHECNVFQYELNRDIQGKIGEDGGIFFDISEIKIICFKAGICFLIFKTNLPEDKSFTDILNFNYKFREINSKTYSMKQYENIRLQTDTFKDITEIYDLIKEITGNSTELKTVNFDNEKMMVYSYCCLDQNFWNDSTEEEIIESMFEKYRMILPAGKHMSDKIGEKKSTQILDSNYVRYGISNSGTVLLTSDVQTQNYTTIAQKFESEYLYTYILELYKKLLLKMISQSFNKTGDFKKVENLFLQFTKKMWIQELTEDEFGRVLSNRWSEYLKTEEIFFRLKNKYDILYKNYNIEEVSKKNGKFAIAIVVLIVIGVINLIIQLLS